jgi:hypothetical protein
MTNPADRLRHIQTIIFAIAVVGSLSAALAAFCNWDMVAGPLLSLSAHAWMGLLIALVLRFSWKNNGA